MKFRAMLFIGLLAVSSLAGASYPHILNAGVLRADCELLDRPSQVRCEAFLMGVVDTVNALTYRENIGKKFYCLPGGITEIRLRQVFVEYISAGYVEIKDPAVDVALAAFRHSFPCK